ncbi:hypothetical protein JZ751_008989 [Albula glossodonta]|uniref:Uncharacterized protein n=1 Tax=Albula glossodonta TaxID=121402 RepID=A0A8T2NXP9_9TELE|nr:hypothetical protein JZ751_008989 [Albula glossodonta]
MSFSLSRESCGEETLKERIALWCPVTPEWGWGWSWGREGWIVGRKQYAGLTSEQGKLGPEYSPLSPAGGLQHAPRRMEPQGYLRTAPPVAVACLQTPGAQCTSLSRQ